MIHMIIYIDMIICIYVYVIYKHTCMNIISVPFPVNMSQI